MRPSLRPLILVTLVLFAAPFSGPASDAQSTCDTEYVPAVGEACRLPNGLWQVVLDDGHVQTTHGADPYVPDDEVSMSSVNERQPACATDYYQHVLYGYPANGEDRYDSVVGTIRQTIRRMNWILNADALESGDKNADYKVLCDSTGLFRVDRFVVPSSSSDFSSVVSAARNAGFNKGNVDYTIFYDGTSSGVCGVGHMWYDERPQVYNSNNNGGAYGVTYNNCWTGRTAQHENGHNQGAVQRTAPDSDSQAHCIEGIDIMCYPTSQVLVLCRDRAHFDCDHDTYFDAASEPGEWLHTHWNIGSSVNRFILFNGPPPNEAPTADFTFSIDGKTLTVDATSSTDPEGAPLTFHWTFGDGASGSGATATHTYAEGGRYRVDLSVRDGAGGEDSLFRRVSVGLEVPPSTQSFEFTGVLECTVTFNGLETKDACGGAQSDDHRFYVEPGVTGVHSVVVWEKSAAVGGLGTEQMRYLWNWPPGVGEGVGVSPLVATHEVSPDYIQHMEGGDFVFTLRPSGTPVAVVGQPYTVCITVMYGYAEAPTDVACG